MEIKSRWFLHNVDIDKVLPLVKFQTEVQFCSILPQSRSPRVSCPCPPLCGSSWKTEGHLCISPDSQKVYAIIITIAIIRTHVITVSIIYIIIINQRPRCRKSSVQQRWSIFCSKETRCIQPGTEYYFISWKYSIILLKYSIIRFCKDRN